MALSHRKRLLAIAITVTVPVVAAIVLAALGAPLVVGLIVAATGLGTAASFWSTERRNRS